ncbi:hypothetical protein [Streptomyces sp. NPDC057854]|uniref:hypothetical protein n=1 Tax=unclassified Streptomyces TaxID=2593676 RepID=UPI0036C3E90C
MNGTGGAESDTSLRQRIAQAIHRYDAEQALSGNDTPGLHHYGEADAVLAVLGDTGPCGCPCTACTEYWEQCPPACADGHTHTGGCQFGVPDNDAPPADSRLAGGKQPR